MKPWLLVLGLGMAVGCGGRTLGAASDDAGNGSGDAAVVFDAHLTPDAADPCHCAPGEVYRNHPCVPTTELGCSPTCDENVGCGEALRCEPCAASSGCGDDDCRPACVYEYRGPIEKGDLRIHPTSGPAGQETEVTITGNPWIVAALWYDVVFGYPTGQDPVRELSSDSLTCRLRVVAPPDEPGTVPVFVSQYGGMYEPQGELRLAGYFTYTAGAPPPTCTQPGYPCADASECCHWFPMIMGCDGGWCEYIYDNPVP